MSVRVDVVDVTVAVVVVENTLRAYTHAAPNGALSNTTLSRDHNLQIGGDAVYSTPTHAVRFAHTAKHVLRVRRLALMRNTGSRVAVDPLDAEL